MGPVDKFRLHVFGAFEFTSPSGKRIVLGKKAQAILSILAFKNGRAVTRARMQDMLWSRSGPQHGRDSLKKALQQIRMALPPGSENILEIEGDRLRLNLDRVWVDAINAPETYLSTEILEGLDINDPQFETWLRSVRQDPKIGTTSHGIERHDQLDCAQMGRLRLAIQTMDTPLATNPPDSAGDMILTRLMIALKENDLIDVIDLRGEDKQTLGQAETKLTFRSISVGNQVVIQLTMHSCADSVVIWTAETVLEFHELRGPLLRQAISQFADQIHAALWQFGCSQSHEQVATTRFALDGIENLFRLEPPNLIKAAESFRNAIDIAPRGSLYAWCAFMTPFSLEQSKGAEMNDLREQAALAISRATEMDRNGLITRSLLAHVHSFLFRDFNKADALLSPLQSQAQSSPLFYFSLSMLRFYQGEISQAHKAAQSAQFLGAFHPYSYAFSTSRCMVDLAGGNPHEAIRHGRSALAAMPDSGGCYEPSLRYLTASYASAGRFDEARSSWMQLQQLNPANTMESLRKTNFPVPAEHARTTLQNSFRSIENAIG